MADYLTGLVVPTMDVGTSRGSQSSPTAVSQSLSLEDNLPRLSKNDIEFLEIDYTETHFTNETIRNQIAKHFPSLLAPTVESREARHNSSPMTPGSPLSPRPRRTNLQKASRIADLIVRVEASEEKYKVKSRVTLESRKIQWTRKANSHDIDQLPRIPPILPPLWSLPIERTTMIEQCGIGRIRRSIQLPAYEHCSPCDTCHGTGAAKCRTGTHHTWNKCPSEVSGLVSSEMAKSQIDPKDCDECQSAGVAPCEGCSGFGQVVWMPLLVVDLQTMEFLNASHPNADAEADAQGFRASSIEDCFSNVLKLQGHGNLHARHQSAAASVPVHAQCTVERYTETLYSVSRATLDEKVVRRQPSRSLTLASDAQYSSASDGSSSPRTPQSPFVPSGATSSHSQNQESFFDQASVNIAASRLKSHRERLFTVSTLPNAIPLEIRDSESKEPGLDMISSDAESTWCSQYSHFHAGPAAFSQALTPSDFHLVFSPPELETPRRWNRANSAPQAQETFSPRTAAVQSRKRLSEGSILSTGRWREDLIHPGAAMKKCSSFIAGKLHIHHAESASDSSPEDTHGSSPHVDAHDALRRRSTHSKILYQAFGHHETHSEAELGSHYDFARKATSLSHLSPAWLSRKASHSSLASTASPKLLPSHPMMVTPDYVGEDPFARALHTQVSWTADHLQALSLH